MDTTKLLAEAKEYIDIAESADSKREAYWRAGDRIVALSDSGMGYREIGDRVGKGKDYAHRLATWRRSAETGGTDLPFARVSSGSGGGGMSDPMSAAAKLAKITDQLESFDDVDSDTREAILHCVGRLVAKYGSPVPDMVPEDWS